MGLKKMDGTGCTGYPAQLFVMQYSAITGGNSEILFGEETEVFLDSTILCTQSFSNIIFITLLNVS